MGRRAVALVVDWVLSMAVASVFWPDPEAIGPRFLGAEPTATLLVFVVSTILLVGLLGHSVGHRLLGLRVARLVAIPAGPGAGAPQQGAAQRAAADGPPGPVAAAVRTALLALVIPAVVWDRDGRGLHDVAARTVIVRR
ncbi:RDD family protein [Actinotalea sp.]|uniref:RDD family protein n=1 Tax=Actinotalea sp. TaxID=1872145 RepID=UPI003565FADE